MKQFLFVAVLLVAADARAAQRYEMTAVTCVKAQSAIERDGAVILFRQSARTGVRLFDRYVRSSQFCQAGEVAAKAKVRTADSPGCPVRRCVGQSRSRPR